MHSFALRHRLSPDLAAGVATRRHPFFACEGWKASQFCEQRNRDVCQHQRRWFHPLWQAGQMTRFALSKSLIVRVMSMLGSTTQSSDVLEALSKFIVERERLDDPLNQK